MTERLPATFERYAFDHLEVALRHRADLPRVRRHALDAYLLLTCVLDPPDYFSGRCADPGLEIPAMADQKKINRLKLMMTHIDRTLDHPEPDLGIVEKLLSDALNLAMEMREPPNPYVDTRLRPGLTVGEAAARGMIAPPEGG